MVDKKPLVAKVSKRYPMQVIKVLGARDPRGFDNEIEVFLDGEDRLHIRVYKAQRCYTFSHVEESNSFVEVIQI